MEDAADKLISYKVKQNPLISNQDLRTFLLTKGVIISLEELSQKRTEIEKGISAQPIAFERPSEVKLITALQIVGSIVSFVIGGLLLWAVSIISALRARGYELPSELALDVAAIETVGSFLGTILLILAFLGFILAYGSWKGKGWAWALDLVLAIVGIIMGIFTLPLGIIFIILHLSIIYCLTRDRVKKFFGKTPALPPIV